MGEERNAYGLLVGWREGKRPLGRSRRRWVDNIKMDLGEWKWGGGIWICLAQGRDERRFMNVVRTFSFHKMLGNHRVAIQLVAARVVLSSTDLVMCYYLHQRSFPDVNLSSHTTQTENSLS
jgi:hypothetical protein